MGLFDDTINKIKDIIDLSSTIQVYTMQCKKICDTLKEINCQLTIHKSELISSNDKLNNIFHRLNDLFKVVDGLRSENWTKNRFSIPVMEPIKSLAEIMKSITEFLKNIGISLICQFVDDNQSAYDDLKGLLGFFSNPRYKENEQVQNKLAEITKQLCEFEKKTKKSKRQKSKSRQQHKSKKKQKEEQNQDQEPDQDQNFPDQSISIDDSQDISINTSFDDSEFDDIQTFKLKQSDIINEKTVIERNDYYTIYGGKLVKSNEDIHIMEFNNTEDFEDKFKRIVNIFIKAQHPNLETFVGSIEEKSSDISKPPYYAVVTKAIGEKLSVILKRAKARKPHRKDAGKPLNDNDDYRVNLKEGYRTIIAFNVAKAMAYLHSQKITHRDLCSSNITIDKNYNPKIINFANSRFIPDDEYLWTLKLKGNSNFRAPEFVTNYDESVDVFSFGGLLYELLMGSPPFGKYTPKEAELRIENGERPIIPHGASEDLNELITSCWSQDPKLRPKFAEIIDKMLTKRISFPYDSKTSIVTDFYLEKSIKNVNLNACLDNIRSISENINHCYAYINECIRVRSFLYNYQFLLQTSDIESMINSKDMDIRESVETSLSNLRYTLDDLLNNLIQTQENNFCSSALRCSATMIPEKIFKLMEYIHIYMVQLGFNVDKYNYVKSDILRDFRFLYMCFSQYADVNYQAKLRLKEIEEFLENLNLQIEYSKDEIDERVKEIFKQFKNYQLPRDDFKIASKELLGYGFSSQVFSAIQKSTHQEVAIKSFNDDYLNDPDITDLLLREISSLVYLKHDYLVNFIGLNYEEDKPIWLISEKVHNGELFDAISEKKLNPFQKTKIAFEIAEGMEYLHMKRIIHRDLKTSNILLENDTPKIADFGYSRVNLNLKMTGRIGTINYMAPEVIQREKYGFKADVFSYGLILWELYFQKHPFFWLGNDKESISNAIIEDAKLMYDKKLSDDLKQLIEDAKNFNPDKRPSFSQIIERMIDDRIAYSAEDYYGKRYDDERYKNDIENFYQMKAKKRAEFLESQKSDDEKPFLLSSILSF